MFDSTTVQSVRTFVPDSIPFADACSTSWRLIASHVSARTRLMFFCSVDFFGASWSIPKRQNERYVLESAR